MMQLRRFRLNGRRPPAAERGFTLMELMIVVVIIAILATLAVYGVRKYILSAKTLEGREVSAAIMAGQEAYYNEMFQYLDVSGGMNYYPEAPTTWDGTIKYQWGGNAGCAACIANFNRLGVTVDQPVAFRYISRAGAPGATLTQPSEVPNTAFSALSAMTEPWYTVFAVSDMDGDGADFTSFAASSVQAEILVFNTGE